MGSESLFSGLRQMIETARDLGRGGLRDVAYINDAAQENALDALDRSIDDILGYVVAREVEIRALDSTSAFCALVTAEETQRRQDEALAALERIAWPEFEKDSGGRLVGCRCGHRYEMCNAVNAARWCGGDALRGESIARHTLGYVDDLGLITTAGQARYDELRAQVTG